MASSKVITIGLAAFALWGVDATPCHIQSLSSLVTTASSSAALADTSSTVIQVSPTTTETTSAAYTTSTQSSSLILDDSNSSTSETFIATLVDSTTTLSTLSDSISSSFTTDSISTTSSGSTTDLPTTTSITTTDDSSSTTSTTTTSDSSSTLTTLTSSSSSSTTGPNTTDDPICITGADCQTGHECNNNGRCQCLTTADCRYGVCDTGFCVGGTDCADNSFCAPGQVCQFGVCGVLPASTTTLSQSSTSLTPTTTTTTSSTHAPLCTPAGPQSTESWLQNGDFDHSGEGQYFGFPWSGGISVQEASSSAPARSGDYVDVVVNPSYNVQGSMYQSNVQMDETNPYRVTFWVAVAAGGDQTGKCRFDVGPSSKYVPQNYFEFDLAETTPLEYQKGSIDFSMTGYSNGFALSFYCYHPENLNEAVEATLLIDDVSLVLAPQTCGVKGSVDNDLASDYLMSGIDVTGVDSQEKCVYTCFQNWPCLTSAFDGTHCYLYKAVLMKFDYTLDDTSAVSWYERSCSYCLNQATVPDPSVTTTTSAAIQVIT